jgi:hypothetical protein
MSQNKNLFDSENLSESTEPVECLGMVFPNEASRRDYFLGKLREKLNDPEFCKTEGFPIGDVEDILELSDPPYFTACPNPFLEEIVRYHGTPYEPEARYHCEPFAIDVTAGKNDTIYMAHSYHTKVPHQAILRYILHYTKPGDIVLDGFCGSGMTGVAATLCADLPPLEKQAIEQEMPGVEWGKRFAILNDLSPAAAFIAHNYNVKVDPSAFVRDATRLIEQVKSLSGNLYKTSHSGSASSLFGTTESEQSGVMNYCVWSEVMICPECQESIVFFDHAVDQTTDPIAVKEEFSCPGCNARLKKRMLINYMETVYDSLLKENVQRVKRVPVSLKYTMGGKHFSKALNALDQSSMSAQLEIEPDVPAPFVMPTGGLSETLQKEGLTHLHHFYTARNFLTISRMIAASKGLYRRQLLNLIQSISVRLCSFLTTYQLGKRGNVPMTGTLFVGSLLAEANPIKSLEGKLKDFQKVYQSLRHWNYVSCGSSSKLVSIPDSSVDYVFIDPPFGDNLNYSQLNMLWEGWLRLRTNVASEAIVDRYTKRSLGFYHECLRNCLTEFHRVLKPGRWMTVEFHNSKNSVWNAIQAAIIESGFVIADVRTLDEKQGTPKQVNNVNAVKQDLVISAYKPTEVFENQFLISAGTISGIWSFVNGHLEQLPVFVSRSGKGEVIAERQKHLLFDRMIAFHIQRGVSIPISASEFYSGLQQNYPMRDGMYFLPQQISDYDRQRIDVRVVEQLEMFVTDEKSAIQWIRRQLELNPMTFQELQPIYMKETRLAWEKHETPIELRGLLEENFIQDQSGFWLSPDPNKEADLEQIRHRALLKEFQQYVDSNSKLKVVRTEALRAGFKDRYQKKDFVTIVQIAKKVSESIIQDDQSLLIYLDNALMKVGE